MSGVIGTDSSTPALPDGQEAGPRLKEQITTGTYRVDARALAREMLFKLRMIALLRHPDVPASFRG
jgi:hypothetical protein